MTSISVPRLPAALLESEAFLLGRVRTRLIRRLIDAHSALGLRIGQGPILTCLDDQGELSQRQLAQLLDVDPSDLVRHVDELQAAGFVARRADPDDRRRNMLAITAEGQLMRQRYDATIRLVEEAIFGGIAAEDRRTLRRILRQIATAPELESASGEEGEG
jgi:DNA-binding MarR family transcriptional regulator